MRQRQGFDSGPVDSLHWHAKAGPSRQPRATWVLRAAPAAQLENGTGFTGRRTVAKQGCQGLRLSGNVETQKHLQQLLLLVLTVQNFAPELVKQVVNESYRVGRGNTAQNSPLSNTAKCSTCPIIAPN